jgi:hypothetical protein
MCINMHHSYVTIELDHIFIFTDLAEQAAQSLKEFGLTEGTSNVHPGQGTACRRFFFNNAYLELVWVTSEEEIKSAVVTKAKLWERSKYKLTRYSPFGLCFRRRNQKRESGELFEDCWQYKPSYFPDGIYANIASNTNFPGEHMLFELVFDPVALTDHPRKYQQPLNHRRGFQEITKVILKVRGPVDHLSDAMKKVISNSIVTLEEGDNYVASLEFDHGVQGGEQSF